MVEFIAYSIAFLKTAMKVLDYVYFIDKEG